MTQEKMTPLRRRMVEDMQLRGLGEKTQASYIRAVEAFAGFLGRSPDTATPEDLRAWQLHMARTKVGVPSFNHRITVLRFFFCVTCGRDDMTRHMRFRRAPRKLPAVLSPDQVARFIEAAPGPGLNYKAALSIAYGAGLRASEAVNLKLGGIDSARMIIRVPYYHVVFTLPARIADIAYTNKAVVYDLLLRASAETLLTIAADPRHLGARIGMTSVLHSWGSALRDALIVALLITCPTMRLGNLSMIEIGHYLLRGKDSCQLRFAAHEMKARKPVEIPIPESLLPYLGHYIETVRSVLLGATDTTRLWITRYGQPMKGKTLHASICKVTERAFGQPIDPHLFRDCAVTTIALEDPKHIGIAPSKHHGDLAIALAIAAFATERLTPALVVEQKIANWY